MADAETPDANKEAGDEAAGKTPEQQAKEGKAFLKDERKRELPKDDWPGKDSIDRPRRAARQPRARRRGAEAGAGRPDQRRAAVLAARP